MMADTETFNYSIRYSEELLQKNHYGSHPLANCDHEPLCAAYRVSKRYFIVYIP